MMLTTAVKFVLQERSIVVFISALRIDLRSRCTIVVG
jgi:hypothetical protein